MSAAPKAPRPGRATRPPSGNPVRAQSRYADDPVLANFRRRICKDERELAQEAVDAFMVRSRKDERRREAGARRRSGALWRAATVVYSCLAGYAQSCEEVFPSVERIAQQTGFEPSTVHVAKAQLKAAGLVDWSHRCEPLEDPGPGQPPIRQIPNLYRVNELPDQVLKCLKPPRRAKYNLAVAVSSRAAKARQKKANADAEAKATQMKAARGRGLPQLPGRALIVSGRRVAGAPPADARDSS